MIKKTKASYDTSEYKFYCQVCLTAHYSSEMIVPAYGRQKNMVLCPRCYDEPHPWDEPLILSKDELKSEKYINPEPLKVFRGNTSVWNHCSIWYNHYNKKWNEA